MLLLAALSGCKSELAERCETAVRHMTNPVPLPEGSEPGAEEQRLIDIVLKASINSCVKEGLSKEQADCILRVQTMDQLMELGECPAIKAKKPGWLQLAPTRAQMDELQHEMQKQPDAGM